MPPRTRTEKTSKPAEKTPVFVYEQLVSTLTGRLDAPGPSSAAVLAAIQAGYRPSGEPTADVTHDTERMVAHVVWTVPVREA